MPTWLLSPWSWLAMGLAALSIAGAGAYAGYRWEEGVAKSWELKLANYKNAEAAASLKKFQDTAKTIEAASGAYVAEQTVLKGQFDVIAKDLKNVQAKTPLDPRCKLAPERLRVIRDAVSRANAATEK